MKSNAMKFCIALLLQFVLGHLESALRDVLNTAPDSSYVTGDVEVDVFSFDEQQGEPLEPHYHITDSNKYLDINVESLGATSREECLSQHQQLCNLLEEEVDENACSVTEHMGYAFIKPEGCFHFFSMRFEVTRTLAFAEVIQRSYGFHWHAYLERAARLDPTESPHSSEPEDSEEFPQDFKAPWNTAKMHDPEASIGEEHVGYYYPRSSKLGKDVVVYVLDSGFCQKWREDSYEFGDRVLSQFSTLSRGQLESDHDGHGTHCAGTVASTTFGMAMGVKIYPVQVLGTWGGNTRTITLGLDHVSETCLDDQICVVSMSLGTINGPSTLLNRAVDMIVKSGINVIAAAGNGDKDAKDVSPASAPSAITVGSVGKDLSRTSGKVYDTEGNTWGSNWGPHVDVWAPGEDVTSTHIGGRYRTSDGTSMAAPAVAAIVAMMQADEGRRLTRAEVMNKFENGWALKNAVKDPKEGKNLFAIRPFHVYNGRVQFALLTYGHCAKHLPFGPCDTYGMSALSTIPNTEAKVCSNLEIANHMHNTWIQEVWDSNSMAMVIRWKFPDTTSLRERFENAIEHCVPVGYEIDLPTGEEHYRTSEWCFSDSGFVIDPWGKEGDNFGAKDGFWGGSDHQVIKGSNSMDMANSAMGVFGFGNHGGSEDEACSGYWMNGQKHESEDLRVKMFMETREAKSCTWEHATNKDFEMVCTDGHVCNGKLDPDGWGCCADHGDRATCPKNLPIMCAQTNACGGGTTRCCGNVPHACDDLGGVRPCNILQHNYDCSYKGCYWDMTQKDVEWGYYATTGGDCESCRQRCSEDENCGAVECGPQMDYCAWWRTDMCSDPDESNSSWYTCRKKDSTVPEHDFEDRDRRELRSRLLLEVF